MRKMTNKKGFTLMEMLIVVAIIAILVAICIPTFSNSLNNARVATDEANIRAAYAEVMANYLANVDGDGDNGYVIKITMTGNASDNKTIGNFQGKWNKDDKVEVKVAKDGNVSITNKGSDGNGNTAFATVATVAAANA